MLPDLPALADLLAMSERLDGSIDMPPLVGHITAGPDPVAAALAGAGPGHEAPESGTGDEAPPDEHTVWIYDYVGARWGPGVHTRQLVAEIAALPPTTRLTVRINSPGGRVFDGFALVGALQDHPGPVLTVADGLAASAASLILQAGDTRAMRAGSRVMIHHVASAVWGNAAAMRREADVIDSLSRSAAEIYAARSGRPAAEYTAAMDAETWFSADEAIRAGLADVVLHAATPGRPAGSTTREQLVRARARARGMRRP
jgi:ATP-dependent protease ClpP protease subunit